MRTDLKLDYAKLREIKGEISEYRQSLERVDNGLTNLKDFLMGQESEAVDKLNKKLSDVTINIRDKTETMQLLEETLENYVDDMEKLVKAEGGGITRVDTWDISFNLNQIQTAVRESFRPMSSTVRGMPHFSLIEDEEEKEKKKKRERNYNRLERFRSSDIMSLKRRVDGWRAKILSKNRNGILRNWKRKFQTWKGLWRRQRRPTKPKAGFFPISYSGHF